MWEENAEYAYDVYGSFVNWDERFYICPHCGDLVYECDWIEEVMQEFICPICESVD